MEGVLDSDEEGWVRLWLPQDLIDRIEETARRSTTTPEVEIRFTLEEAYPRVPTLGDYILELRRRTYDDQDEATRAFIESAEKQIEENPMLGDLPLKVKTRGWEVGPDE